ncbi:MAG: hypothetical protein ABS79_05300 [Planctomycetes bacterium SCN 63-9]|nr:MAG: hypothetical protein ABS79_05300 [Planctomycetes bacterium SCN 63-9]
MRRTRRGGSHGLEFGGSGEDSFVAVVVTKLTGALLFILLLTMVIMVLIPKAIDVPASPSKAGEASTEPLEPLKITTDEGLPEAIAGRPYSLALAASGGTGLRKWSVQGPLPEGLEFDSALGRIKGTPAKGTPEPLTLMVRVSDGSKSDTKSTRLTVYQPDGSLTLPSRWKPSLPPIPWKSWLDQGLGFLLIWIVHLLAMNIVRTMERPARIEQETDEEPSDAILRDSRRFFLYRWMIRITTALATLGLTLWLIWPRFIH